MFYWDIKHNHELAWFGKCMYAFPPQTRAGYNCSSWAFKCLRTLSTTMDATVLNQKMIYYTKLHAHMSSEHQPQLLVWCAYMTCVCLLLEQAIWPKLLLLQKKRVWSACVCQRSGPQSQSIRAVISLNSNRWCWLPRSAHLLLREINR